MTESRFEQCIRQMNAGDKDGLRAVYEEYLTYIYGIMLTVLKNKENAEDVTSDFFIKLWDKSESYRPSGGHRGWMATIARNMAIDYIRKHRREELTELLAGMEEEQEDGRRTTRMNRAVMREQTGAPSGGVEDIVVEDITIKQVLGYLNDVEKMVVHMKIMGGLTFKEIAETLHIPMGTVTWRYREAMNKLRRCGYEEL